MPADTVDDVLKVLTPPSVFIAALGGFALGSFVLSTVIRDPRYGSAASARHFGRLVAGIGLIFGGVFYAGQVASAYFDGDPQWTRAATRYGLWVLFALAAGAGTWFGLRK